MAMQEQIKSLEEKNKKLDEKYLKLFSDNKRLSSEIRKVKHQIENVRARDNCHQLQLQNYSKLLNEEKNKNIELENIIKAGLTSETISQEVKAQIGYDDLCTENVEDEPKSDDLKAICEILSSACDSSAYIGDSSRCPSLDGILEDYLSDVESNCDDFPQPEEEPEITSL